MLVVIGVAYARTKDPKWRRLSFFWVKVYGLIFALGVATGIVQEFEFGMNWADYSRFVGNVFGSLLAAEGVFAFSLEGGFLGLLLFGGNRLGPRLWLFATIMVVFGAHFSALWIIMANSWMQTPQGYTIATDPAPARAVMTDFWQVVFTPSFMPRLLHVFFASWTVGAALMISVSAFYVLRKRHLELAVPNLKVGLAAFILFATANFGLGGAEHGDRGHPRAAAQAGVDGGPVGEHVVRPAVPRRAGWTSRPRRRPGSRSRACSACWPTSTRRRRSRASTTFARRTRPRRSTCVFQVYHFMFGMGSLFVPIGLLAGLLYWRKQRLLTDAAGCSGSCVVTVFFVEAAIIAGWWTAEIGRQPWVVYNVLATADGVSPTLSGLDVAVSLGMFIALYAILLALFLYLLNRRDPARPGAARGRGDRRPWRACPTPSARSSRRRDRAAVEWRGLMLAEIWFALFVIIVAGYLILDGFDMGVGMLMIPMGKNDDERRTMLNSIGPIWDGNEVWLVIAGGVLFGVFPARLRLAVLGLLPRVHAGAVRDDPAHGRDGVPEQGAVAALAVVLGHGVRARLERGWRSCWAWPSATSCRGCRWTRTATCRSRSSGCSSPSPLLVGATTVAMFAMHGACTSSRRPRATCRPGSGARCRG